MTTSVLFSLRRIDWVYTTWIAAFHLLALLAFLPWFFSWTGVILFAVSIVLFGTLGINIGYHRLLTHRGFECPKWLEYTLAILGLCSLQDGPAGWVAVHRRHHEHADEPPDPHSPIISFLWSHVGWLLVKTPELDRLGSYARYAKDLLRERFYRALEFRPLGFAIVLASWLLFFGGGFLAERAMGGSYEQALQFGSSLLVWGVFVRTVYVWHVTWSVNSAAHSWGYRNYATGDGSRNNWFVALVSNGEGWHNNHHADQRSARHGHNWYEIDVSFWLLLLLRRLGLVWNIAYPRTLHVQRGPVTAETAS
jgi:fatty-acid desaturase